MDLFHEKDRVVNVDLDPEGRNTAAIGNKGNFCLTELSTNEVLTSYPFIGMEGNCQM